jgi:poly(A) polymerase
MIELLAHKDALVIIDLLAQQGYETRFVGGCVRDALLKRDLGDIDLASTALPDQVIRILSDNHINVIPTGIDHGTVTAVINKIHFEITTLRKDIATDGRHATVEFSDDWELDARRRDFTINALSVDRHGQLFDYCNGQKDLETKTLRFIGDAEARIQEDYLRILRFFRFASVLDWPIQEDENLQNCIALAFNLSSLSRERVQSEVYKLLLGRGVKRIVEVLNTHKILFRHFAIERFNTVVDLEIQHHEEDPLRRLIALIGWDDVSNLEKFIVLTRQNRKRLEQLKILQNSNESLDAALYYYGVETVKDFYYLCDYTIDYIQIQNWEKPVFPLKADIVIQALQLEGPALGDALKRAERHWVAQQFKPMAEELLGLLK